MLVGVGNTGPSPHLPADRQGPAAVSDSCHQNLSFPGELEGVNQQANRPIGRDGCPQKKLRGWRVATLRVYRLVGKETPNLLCFALELRRPDALGGNLREVDMLGFVKAGDHPAKVVTLRLVQLLRQVLAKSLVHLTLKTKAARHRWFRLVSCWSALTYNLPAERRKMGSLLCFKTTLAKVSGS